jgi:Putative Actinobacterial Holin-X, holin superfamily III
MTANDSRSVSELFGDALSQFSKLVRNELQLARAEISMKVNQTTTAIGLLAGAAVFLIPALVLLLMSLATWMVEMPVLLWARLKSFPPSGDDFYSIVGFWHPSIQRWKVWPEQELVGFHALRCRR